MLNKTIKDEGISSIVVTLFVRLQCYKHIPFLLILWVVQFKLSETETFDTLCAQLSTRKCYVFLEMLVTMKKDVTK